MSDDRSGRCSAGSASRCSSSGRAIASPTTVTTWARSRSASSQISAASSEPGVGRTTVPPPKRTWNAPHWAATCISGGVMTSTSPVGGIRSGSSSGSEIGTPESWGSPPPMAAKKMSS